VVAPPVVVVVATAVVVFLGPKSPPDVLVVVATAVVVGHFVNLPLASLQGAAFAGAAADGGHLVNLPDASLQDFASATDENAKAAMAASIKVLRMKGPPIEDATFAQPERSRKVVAKP